MFLSFDDRISDSPFIERVWRSHSDQAGVFLSVAAIHFEIAVTRLRGKTFITLRGPETKATSADCPAEGEWLGIRFKLGTFMPPPNMAELPVTVQLVKTATAALIPPPRPPPNETRFRRTVLPLIVSLPSSALTPPPPVSATLRQSVVPISVTATRIATAASPSALGSRRGDGGVRRCFAISL